MIKSFFHAISLLLLLSTVAAAQTSGTSGATGTSGTTAAPAPPAKAAAVSNDYRLMNGDKLRIEVYKDEQLSQSLQIRPDGKITLPLVGDVMAAGKTAMELDNAITEALREYVKSPALDVTVIVVETVPMMVHVIGEVNDPGAKPVNGETSILQVLAMSGGFTEWAKKKEIRIMRKGPKGETTIPFNYNDAVNGRGKVLMVQPGDMIIVP